jgi:hypothetical protein
MRTYRSAKHVLLALACGLWMVHHTLIRHLYADVVPPVRVLVPEWHSMVKEIVNAKQQTAIIHGNSAHFLYGEYWLLYECYHQGVV